MEQIQISYSSPCGGGHRKNIWKMTYNFLRFHENYKPTDPSILIKLKYKKHDENYINTHYNQMA